MAGKARSASEEIPASRQGKLSLADRAVIRGMLSRGDRIQDVSYWFGVSPSTVHKLKTVVTPSVRPVAATVLQPELPPPGPYKLVQRTQLIRMDDEATIHRGIVAGLKSLLADAERKLLSLGSNNSDIIPSTSGECAAGRVAK